MGRPGTALQRGKLVRAALIVIWFVAGGFFGILAWGMTNWLPVGIFMFAVTLAFLYIFWTLVSGTFLPTGQYYVMTDKRALLLHVRSSGVQIEAVGMRGISDVQIIPDSAHSASNTLHFGGKDDSAQLQFTDLLEADTVYRLAREAMISEQVLAEEEADNAEEAESY